jgi:xanthine dehydrogenase YagR molybdenum-binding subunit
MSSFRLNHAECAIPEDADALLVDVIRDSAGLTGTKLVCGSGVCGACTVLVDRQPLVSCLLPAHLVAGKTVTTVEGLSAGGLHPVQKAFMALDALQCGFCTPGFVVEAVAFYEQWRKANSGARPSREAIGAALSGHLCRCGAYDNILEAVALACSGRFEGDATASPRVEARDKVTGAAKYTVDIRHDNQLEGVILRSSSAHARIIEVDLAPARAMAGVAAAVLLVGDDRIVRYVGAPIAAVAAKNRATALSALAAIRIVNEPLPAVVGMDAARRPGAPVVFERSQRKMAGNVSEGGAGAPTAWKQNVRGPSAAFSHGARKVRTWVAAAREARDPLLIEGTFRTGAQSHTCLEPHAAVARFDDGRLTLHVSTQAVFHLKALVAKRWKLAPDQVTIVAHHIGGGFGSKSTVGVESIAAIELAREAKAPVRVAFDRHEELTVAGYRPAAEMKVALLATREGALKALSMTAHADTGASVNSTIAALARLIYPAEAKALADFDVVSNLPPGAPFRAPGGPQMAFALEQAVDEAALRLDMDPIALRKRWDPDPNRQRLYDWASGLAVWRDARGKARQTGRFRRGVGVATGYWLYLWQPGTKVELSVKGGRLAVGTATQDIGTGSRTVLANTVAREFGLEPSEIDVRIGDSGLPEGPMSGGSRTTASIVPPTLIAVRKLKAAIEQNSGRGAAPGSNAPWREMLSATPDIAVSAERAEDSRQTAPGVRSPLKDVGIMGAVFGWMMRRFANIAIGAGLPSSVQVIEIEVDTWLGQVRVLSVHSGIAVGKIAAPELARSQAAGAVVQGIGYALYEGREVDPVTGCVLSAGLEDYRIPGIADTPVIDLHFDEGGFDHVLGGSVGIGEAATVPTSAAVANAICNATGLRPYEIPLRPDRLVAMLRQGDAA